MTVLDVRWQGHRWRINDPGGRIGGVIAGSGGPYERELLTDIAARIEGGRAVDVGAQVGNHTLFLAIVCGLNVSAFEPNPTDHKRLLDNIALNHLATVEAHNIALSDVPGRAAPAPRGTLTLGTGDVKVATLDSLHLDDVTVIKVDVEGMEARVLAGGLETLTRCRPVVYCEAWTDDDRTSVADVLEPLGYRLDETIGRPGWAPNDRWQP